MKKVDNLGRILIPKELRAKYGLNEGAEIEFLDVGEGVAVRALDPLCRICRGEISKRAPSSPYVTDALPRRQGAIAKEDKKGADDR